MDADTITAVATPPGEGGIGIIRVSGPSAFQIADHIFRTASRLLPSGLKSHTLTYGRILDPDNGQIVDQALLGLMRAPHSYTTENTVEFNCHGGNAVLQQVMLLTLKYGARVAEPGEFTKRAFLNGRIDLAQAEAVADLIRAKTDLARQAAANQLVGRLSEQIHHLNEQTADLLALVEATIDFPEEELDLLDLKTTSQKAEQIAEQLDYLLQTAGDGRLLKEGLKIAILGKPNVGKSSLLNSLLAVDRAIVTDIPGTTRDTIEETLNLNGIPVHLVDTAGIRQTDDPIEQIGVEKSHATLTEADLLIIVVDASMPLDESDQQILVKVNLKPALFVLNKVDLPIQTSSVDLLNHLTGVTQTGIAPTIVQTSMIQQTGIEDLKERMLAQVLDADLSQSVLITNARHEEALRAARTAIAHAIDSMKAVMSAEFIALDLRATLDGLGDIVGHTTNDDILGRIFAQFCIGK
ncbi:MAG: tRNA uridine-5-carboxymethylaminomethyl(34) synthesis GTPase MnmE [Candidatus Poribacteria bacterium]|nr:tRNA uridine-5-carboxymethylaminomethyl(34) synthesis GTPase MnmE [Candidatus Poribacteria bacterium]